MTIGEALKKARSELKEHEIETPGLDSALLLAHTFNTSREKLYMDLGNLISKKQKNTFGAILVRRIAGEPVAWITGSKEFWGLSFSIGPGAFCPRPDTETLVETALDFMKDFESSNGPGCLHDCCTGPGSVALALATEKPAWNISASDLSDQVPTFFHRNNKKHTEGQVQYSHSDLLDSVPGPFEIIVSNPPYLTSAEVSEKTALGWREPTMALDGGDDGLKIIRRLVSQALERLRPKGIVLLEADPLQMPEIREILSANGFGKIGIRPDLSGRERVIHGQKQEFS